MLRRVDLVRTDVSEELSASFISVTRIGELETTLAVTSNRRTLRRISSQLLLTANVVSSSIILPTLMMEQYVLPNRQFLQEPHGVTSQKTAFFVAITVKTSNLT
jgi:hypothetical protein